MERDPRLPYQQRLSGDFNSHAHVERDTTMSPFFGTNDNFNSHAHVERDMSTAEQADYIDISTHTLTWSVTFIFYD